MMAFAISVQTMSILTVEVLLAIPQRGSAAVPPPVTRGNFQIVTTSWLRMNDTAIYNNLTAVHAWFKQRGIVNLAEADYQKMLKELKPK